jgi:Flp pilus assembly protein TadD
LYHNDALKKGEAGNHEKEIQLMRKALRLAPSNREIKADLAAAYNDFALSLGKKGEYKKQMAYLAKAVKLAPDNKVIKENLVRARKKGADSGKKGGSPIKKNKHG